MGSINAFGFANDLLCQNGYPVQTEIGVAVNYKLFPNYHYDFDLEKIEKCATFQSCDNAIYKITHCGKCYKLFELTFDDEHVPHEKCAHYLGKGIPSSGGTSVWTYCRRSHNEPGCVTNDAHVRRGVLRGVNEFLELKDYVNTVYLILSCINDFHVYGIDCEMCYTQQSLEATQVTLIDMYSNVVYQTYIKPEREIIDYNSEYSGIYESTLEGVQIRFP